MALKTTNFELIKPQLSDIADITAFNENWDKIDEQLLKAGESGGSDLVQTEKSENVTGDKPTIDPVIQTELDALYSRPVNNNILINSNFANPINQRSQSTYPTSKHTVYTIDRWCIDGSNMEVGVKSGYVNVTSTYDGQRIFAQILEFPNDYVGKTITASIKYRANSANGSIGLGILPNTGGTKSAFFTVDGEWHITSVTLPITASSLTRLRIAVWGNKAFNVDIEWIKAEVGGVATPYIPRLYGDELCMCQRFYQILYPRDSVLYQIDSNGMLFAKSLGVRMRDYPEVDLSDCTLDSHGVALNDFTLTKHSTTLGSVTVKCSKANNVLTINDILTLGGNIYLNAEL